MTLLCGTESRIHMNVISLSHILIQAEIPFPCYGEISKEIVMFATIQTVTLF